jgi:hypothetical protein
MRKFIALLFTTCLFSASAYAVEPQPLDESTNPNSNTDLKTQNMQQKPNSDRQKGTDDKDRGYRDPRSSSSGDMNTNTDDGRSSSRSYR